VGVAVNITFVPEQILVCEATIETPGKTEADTVIVIELEETVAGLAQTALLVTSQIITSPLLNELV
jgi:hypothetical protein